MASNNNILDITNAMAHHFEELCTAVREGNRVLAVGRQSEIAELGCQLIDEVYPHLKDTTTSFPLVNQTIMPNFRGEAVVVDGVYPNKTGLAVAEFVTALLLERKWQEIESQDAMARAAIGRAQHMQKMALMAINFTTPIWCVILVSNLYEQPMSFLDFSTGNTFADYLP